MPPLSFGPSHLVHRQLLLQLISCTLAPLVTFGLRGKAGAALAGNMSRGSVLVARSSTPTRTWSPVALPLYLSSVPWTSYLSACPIPQLSEQKTKVRFGRPSKPTLNRGTPTLPKGLPGGCHEGRAALATGHSQGRPLPVLALGFLTDRGAFPCFFGRTQGNHKGP